MYFYDLFSLTDIIKVFKFRGQLKKACIYKEMKNGYRVVV